jgi:hypothetical protein
VEKPKFAPQLVVLKEKDADGHAKLIVGSSLRRLPAIVGDYVAIYQLVKVQRLEG